MKIKDLVEGPELDRIKKIPGSVAGYFADLNKTFNKKSGFAGVTPPGTAQDRGPTGMGAIRGKGGKVATPKPVKVSKSAPKPTRQPSVTKPDQLDKGSGFSEGGEVYVWDGMNWNSQSGKQLGAMEGWKKFTKAQTKGSAFLAPK
jgi:hypothetical protein